MDQESKYNFASQWLNFLGNTIYNNGKPILVYKGEPNYPLSRLNTRIRIGQEMPDEEEEKKYSYLSFQDLVNLGYAIKGYDDVPFWRRNQKLAYKIIKATDLTIGMTSQLYYRSGMKIQHDAINRRMRLLGDFVIAARDQPFDAGVGDWICYDPDAPIKSQMKRKVKTREEMMMALQGTKQDSSEIQYQYIADVPVLITDEKYIVCLQKQDICQRILVTGASRMGKSTFTNGLSTRIFYKWEDMIGLGIDPQNQFYDISAPQEFEGFNKILKLIGEEPRPIPALQLYLACKNTSLIVHKDISFKLVLDFNEFLNKYGFYTFGNKDWKIEGSKRYIVRIIRERAQDLAKVKDANEMNDIFYEEIPEANDDKKGGNLRGMISKWTNSFESIFNEQFTSNLYQNDQLATSEFKVNLKDGRTLKGHPFIMAMEAGLIPVINTSTVPNKTWVRQYMADLMQKIVTHQKTTATQGKQTRKWFVVDEMQEIYEEHSGKRKDDCSTSFEALFRQVGFNNIGFIGNTQSLEKLNPEMVKNATHIACVYTQSDYERKMVGKIFEIPKDVTSRMSDLRLQEMMIFSNEPFVVYDRWGRRKVITDRKWFKGRIIPPVNYHKAKAGG